MPYTKSLNAVPFLHFWKKNVGTTSLSLVFAVALTGFGQNTFAAEPAIKCPKKITYVENDPLSQKTIVILQKLYAQLGCPIEAIKLPGRRGPLHFNRGLVDGELHRGIPAEKNYSRAFVRSSVPLLEISNRLWRNPSNTDSKAPIAYTLGLAWQEKYIANDTAKTGITHTPIMYNTEKYDAYAKGRIKRFLSADTNVEDMIEKNILGNTPAPIIEKTILTLPLYHYLGAEFAPFMEKFSALVGQTNPFRKQPTPTPQATQATE